MKTSSYAINELKAETRYSCVGGPFGSNLTQRDYREEGVPVIRGVNLPNDREFLDDEFVYVSEQKADALAANTAYPGDLVFTQRGTLGQIGIIPLDSKYPRYIISQSQMKLTVDTAKVHPKYVYYLFRQKHIVEMIKRRAITSGVPHINLGILKSMTVQLPNARPVQDSVVDVLDSYNRLIANNTRRIELLERSARLLFQEWFVRLRYPGHEHDKIVDGVPEGWHYERIEDVADTIGGGTPSTAVPEYWSSPDITWFVPTDITNSDSLVLLASERKISESGLRNSSAKIIPRGSILMTSRASVGFFGIYDEGECSTNQGFIVITPKISYARMFMLHDLMRRKEEIVGRAGGVTYKEINKTTFRNMKILIPSEQIRSTFEQFCADAFRQVRALKRQSERARQARDLLLPRLIDGRIEV